MESFRRCIGVEIDFSSPEPELAMQNGGFASRVGGGHAPPPLRRKNEGLRNADPVYVVLGLCVLGMGVHAPPWLRRKTMVLCPGHGGACPPLAATQNHGFVSRSEAGWPPSPQDKI